jgi:hypothetical protein
MLSRNPPQTRFRPKAGHFVRMSSSKTYRRARKVFSLWYSQEVQSSTSYKELLNIANFLKEPNTHRTTNGNVNNKGPVPLRPTSILTRREHTCELSLKKISIKIRRNINSTYLASAPVIPLSCLCMCLCFWVSVCAFECLSVPSITGGHTTNIKIIFFLSMKAL